MLWLVGILHIQCEKCMPVQKENVFLLEQSGIFNFPSYSVKFSYQHLLNMLGIDNPKADILYWIIIIVLMDTNKTIYLFWFLPKNLSHTKDYYQSCHALWKIFKSWWTIWFNTQMMSLFHLWLQKWASAAVEAKHRRQHSTLNAHKYTILFPRFCKQRWLRSC